MDGSFLFCADKVKLIENRVSCGSQATMLAAWPSLARRSCTAMIACRISQIGTSTVAAKGADPRAQADAPIR
jgi:hypothetical protein